MRLELPRGSGIGYREFPKLHHHWAAQENEQGLAMVRMNMHPNAHFHRNAKLSKTVSKERHC